MRNSPRAAIKRQTRKVLRWLACSESVRPPEAVAGSHSAGCIHKAPTKGCSASGNLRLSSAAPAADCSDPHEPGLFAVHPAWGAPAAAAEVATLSRSVTALETGHLAVSRRLRRLSTGCPGPTFPAAAPRRRSLSAVVRRPSVPRPVISGNGPGRVGWSSLLSSLPGTGPGRLCCLSLGRRRRLEIQTLPADLSPIYVS